MLQFLEFFITCKSFFEKPIKFDFEFYVGAKTGIILIGMAESKFIARFYCRHVSNNFNRNMLSGFGDYTCGR